MLSFFLASTCRSVSSYSFEIFQSMCSEIACSSKLFQSAGQWTRSNAFDKFKRTTHTGIPTSKALSTNALAVKGFSSMRLPQQNDENRVAFRLVVIKLTFDFVQNKTCEYIKNKRNISGKSATCCGRIFVGNMLNKRTTIEALRRDNRYHCTLATNAPRTLLEHVSTPLLSDPHHPRTHAFPTQVPHDPTPPNPHNGSGKTFSFSTCCQKGAGNIWKIARRPVAQQTRGDYPFKILESSCYVRQIDVL